MAVPPLPNELIALIIDHLHDDSASLSTCSLVARCWLGLSRYHLFRRLTVLVRDPAWLSKLLSFLTNCPNICVFVRVLSLWTYSTRHLPPHPPVCHHTIARILGHLPNVMSLAFSSLKLRCGDNVGHSYSIQPRGVDSVTIYGCDGVSNFALPGFLTCFSTINRLEVQKYGAPGHRVPREDTVVIPTHIRQLFLHASSDNDLIPALSICPEICSITIVTATQLSAFGIFVRQLGSGLRQLKTQIGTDKPNAIEDDRVVQSDDFEHFTLSTCVNLELLCISSPPQYWSFQDPEETQAHVVWNAIPHMLASVPHALPVVHFDFVVNGDARDFFQKIFQWRDTDMALDRMRELRSLVWLLRVFETDYEDDVEVYTKMIQEGLPRMSSRGIMRLDITVEKRIPHDWD